MNAKEKLFVDIMDMYTDPGIFVEDDDIRVGYSFIEVNIYNDEDGFDITAYPENDDRFDYPIETETVNGLFDKLENARFVITEDKAREGNFVTWKEFCDEFDLSEKENRKMNLDILSL